MDEPTIFAKASGQGRAALAVVRISGGASREAVRRLAGRIPAARLATLLTLRDPESGDPLDRALVLWFPGPKSFTGEDLVELHLHGGRAVVDVVLEALSRLPGLRAAEPGEFTRRAFRNGKMTITDVEALADLIDAETDAQRRQALRQLDGALGRWAEVLRAALIEALALAEAMIDFADEDDLVRGFDAELRQRAETVATAITDQISASGRGEKLREGLVVTIAGPPNVGKSTLLNRLAGREIAIVSAYAGTTRDAIEVGLDLGGHAVRLIDTAGLRETSDPVEREGILRARAMADRADLVLWLDDGTSQGAEGPPNAGTVWRVMTKADLALPRDSGSHASHSPPSPMPSLRGAKRHGNSAKSSGRPELLRAARNDGLGSQMVECRGPRAGYEFAISAREGTGLDALIEALSDFASAALAGAEGALVTRLRHRHALETADRHLAHVLRASRPQAAELVAEDLRAAVDALAGLVGRIDTEEVLGSIFARFCIGK